jgi:small subunit ribosomal protein S13
MPRIVGVDVPGGKRTEVALTYIYGIGPSTAKKIVEAAGIEMGTKADALNEDELSRISTYIDRNHPIEGRLRRQVNLNVRRLMDIGCYRGLRHRRGLPVRGQRTKTNARTRKGPRRTVARKKGVKEVSRG